MAIQNLSEEAVQLLEKLSPEDKKVIWGMVASPASKRTKAACRRELTAFLVKTLQGYSYMGRIVMYRDLLDLLIREENIPEDNRLQDILGEVAWLNCEDKDRPLAVMMAIKKLNATLSFKEESSKADLELDFAQPNVELKTTEVNVATVVIEDDEEIVDDLDEEIDPVQDYDIFDGQPISDEASYEDDLEDSDDHILV